MNINKLGLLCVVGALFLSGCGKKDKKVDLSSKNVKTKKLASADIPSLTENFLDEDGVQEFAFVDDENAKKDQNLTAKADVSPIATEPVLAMASNDDESEEFASSDEADLQDENGDEAGQSSYAFNTINFDFNKNSIRPDQLAKVEENCEVAREALENQKQLVVQGHCDEFGSASYNMALSQQRAENVKAAMAAKGLDIADIKTVGLGQEMPLVSSDKEDRESRIKELAPNRRAELIVN